MKTILWSVLLMVSMPLSTMAGRADYRVIPLPQSIEADTTRLFTLQSGMAIAYDPANAEVARTAQFLSQWIEQQTGLRLQLSPTAKKPAIRLALSPMPRRLPASPASPAVSGSPASPAVSASPASPAVSVSPAASAVSSFAADNDAYSLTVTKAGVTITAPHPAGLFRGAQTLRKSLPADGPVNLPYATIADQPRFSYRGVHLDCSRHYFPVAVVKQYLDLLALHGCNQFHWHITDDQGWRFEVKALPDLAAKGSIRQQTVIGRNTGIYDGQPYGGYYTQDDCREIVRYAAERYINVIPEIDLPGHMQAALHVYPNLGCTGGPYPVWQIWGVSDDVLCAGNPEVLTFIKTVLGELCDVFPSELIHIGGDECPKGRWKNCPKCQAKIRELGLKDDGKHSLENQLQTYINHEVEKFLTTRGRNLIGWDETLEGGLTESAVVMSWRGVNGGIEAARQHHRVIMTPTDYCYIDYYQLKDTWNLPLAIGGYVPASKVYSFEPLVPGKLTEEEQQYILGPQVNLWTEYIAVPEHLFYMLLPRLDAISEVQWCQPEQKDFDDFKARLPRMMQLYDRLPVSYCHKVE